MQSDQIKLIAMCIYNIYVYIHAYVYTYTYAHMCRYIHIYVYVHVRFFFTNNWIIAVTEATMFSN